KDYFSKNGVCLMPYNDIYEWLKAVPAKTCVMYNKEKINYAIYKNISADCPVVDCENPTLLMKAVKNDTEIENLIRAHIKDGVAFTKFMYWLKTNAGKIPMTEISASDYLEQ